MKLRSYISNPRELFCLFCLVRTQQEVTVFDPGVDLSSDMASTGSLILDFLESRSVERHADEIQTTD